MKVVKSAEHYTETAVDEIKLLKSVSSQFFTGYTQIDPKLGIIRANDEAQRTLVLLYVHVHMKHKGSHTVSHVSVFAHTCFRLTCLTHNGSTVKNEPKCFSQRSIICVVYLLINISRSESDHFPHVFFITILIFFCLIV